MFKINDAPMHTKVNIEHILIKMLIKVIDYKTSMSFQNAGIYEEEKKVSFFL